MAFSAVARGGDTAEIKTPAPTGFNVVPRPVDGGIREEIPAKFKARFAKWKAELMSTRYGRERWERYAGNRSFVLQIRLVEQRGKGAGTDKFLWDSSGELAELR